MKIALYFGDAFWSTVPYQGLSLYHELSKSAEVIPIFPSKDIRLHKKWRGNEKFWFDKNFFTDLPLIETSNLLKTLKTNSIKYLILSGQMQFKGHLAQRNRQIRSAGIKIFMCDMGGADFSALDSKTTGWEYFFSKSERFQSNMSDPSEIKKHFSDFTLQKEDKNRIFVTGCLDYDELSSDYDFHIKNEVLSKTAFCKKYNLDPQKKLIAYIPGNPRPDKHPKYRNILPSIHRVLLDLQGNYNYQICFKTHPNDYISTESPSDYSNVHPRAAHGGYSGPRYNDSAFCNFNTIEAQDGYNLYRACDFAVTNLSHSGWELGYLNKKCFSFKMKEYAGWYFVDNLSDICYIDCSNEKELKDKILSFDGKSETDEEILKEYFGNLDGSSYKNISRQTINILEGNNEI